MLQLAAQLLHEGPKVLGLSAVLRPPDCLQQVPVREDFPRVDGHRAQQFKFGSCQLDLMTVPIHQPGREVDLEVVGIDSGVGVAVCRRKTFGTPDRGTEARCEFLGPKRLGYIVVCTEVKRPNFLAFLVSG